MSSKTYPKDHRDFLYPTIKIGDCSNYGLAIDKFGQNTGEKLDYIGHSGNDILHFPYKSFNLNEGLQLAQKNSEKLFNYYKNKGVLVQLPLQQNWRMVLNLGAATAYNNGFLLHKLYGVPYIPGQAIKGVLRNYCIATYFESQEENAFKNTSFRMLFGNEEVESEEESENINAQQGKLLFFDIFPTTPDFEIEADIMNPHHTKYYDPANLSEYPNDTSAPVPIKFITLKKGKFLLSVCIPKKAAHTKIQFNESSWENPEQALSQLLQDAMKYQGVGAKTNLGYGRLLPNPEILKEMEEAKKAELAKIEKEEKKKRDKEDTVRKVMQRKKEAKEKGITPYIKDATTYEDLQKSANNYKNLFRRLPKDDILPVEDHAPFLGKLTSIYSDFEKRDIDRFNRKRQKRRNWIKSFVGTEKMEKWFTENVKQI
jgi:CRISPR type III-B/RAMP module RAMP protein Cmr6